MVLKDGPTRKTANLSLIRYGRCDRRAADDSNHLFCLDIPEADFVEIGLGSRCYVPATNPDSPVAFSGYFIGPSNLGQVNSCPGDDGAHSARFAEALFGNADPESRTNIVDLNAIKQCID